MCQNSLNRFDSTMLMNAIYLVNVLFTFLPHAGSLKCYLVGNSLTSTNKKKKVIFIERFQYVFPNSVEKKLQCLFNAKLCFFWRPNQLLP